MHHAHERLPHALCARPPKFCAFSHHIKELEEHKRNVEGLFKDLHETVV